MNSAAKKKDVYIQKATPSLKGKNILNEHLKWIVIKT
jgi:hypothetical protein